MLLLWLQALAAHDQTARAGWCVGQRDGLCTRVQILQVCDGKSLVQKLDVFTAVNRHYDLGGTNGSLMGVGSFCWAEF